MTAKIFKFLSGLISDRNSATTNLELITFCGKLASKNYCGSFRDASIEKHIAKLAQNMQMPKSELKASNTNQIVHVFTTIYLTGGHTRFLENLVYLDDRYTHHLVVTDQGDTPPRQSLLNLISSKGGKVHFIEKVRIEDKVQELRDFIVENASKVMLHIHPHDCVPSIALQHKPEALEVFFFNHADHLFSYGCDVSDTIINIREEAHRISVHERFMQKSTILPLPIIKQDASPEKMNLAKAKYGIQEGDIVGLAMGNLEKFFANKKHNFFRTIHTILSHNERLKVFIVGIGKVDFCKELAVIEHERLFFLGLQKDPSDIQQIADIAIDPMPIGSYTALLETCFYGAYPMVCYDTIPLFDLYRDEAFEGKLELDLTEEDYIKHFNAVCQGKATLSKAEVATSIKNTHAGKSWAEQLHLILNGDGAKNTTNTPLPADIQRFYELNQSEEKFRNTVLSFFYENIHLFSKATALKICFFLLNNAFNKKIVLSIFKKRILGA